MRVKVKAVLATVAAFIVMVPAIALAADANGDVSVNAGNMVAEVGGTE
ncbi:hypothetical protein [Gallibacter sp. Marseille-QA0791]